VHRYSSMQTECVLSHTLHLDLDGEL
jgi:hypothetical protein